jgi:hypothetical protein
MEVIMVDKKIILHVGFHKTGSTFVQNYFEKHPDVFFSRKILADFVEDFNSEIPPFLEEIDEEFVFLSDMRLTVNTWGQTELERVNSQNSSLSQIRESQKEITLNLKNRFPTAKILITIRNKVELTTSLYSQYLLNGGRKSFLAFKKESESIEKFFDYDYVQKLYSDHFGFPNVHVINYAELKTNPEEFLKKICLINDFPYCPEYDQVVNPSLSEKSKIKRKIMNNIVYYLLFFAPKSKRNRYFQGYLTRISNGN